MTLAAVAWSDRPYPLIPRGVTMANSFGEWLAAARERRGLSARQLALRSDVTPATISKIEDGLVGVSNEMAEKLAVGLGMDRLEMLSAWVAYTVLGPGHTPIVVTTPDGKQVSTIVPPGYDGSQAEELRLSIETALEVQRRRQDRKEGGK